MRLLEVMLTLDEAMHNLKDYPNKDKAQRAFGWLGAMLNYYPEDTVLVLHVEVEPNWMELKESSKEVEHEHTD